MIYIVDISDALVEVDEISHDREDILQRDMLRDKLLRACADQLLKLLVVAVRLLEYLRENAELYLLVYPQRLNVHILRHILADIHHTVADDLYRTLALVLMHHNVHYARVLDLESLFLRDDLALNDENLARKGSNDVLR